MDSMQEPWPKIEHHHDEPFAPKHHGHYVVCLGDRIYGARKDPHFYKAGAQATDEGRLVITVQEDLKTCFVDGNLEAPRQCSEFPTRFWFGPFKYARRCFKCEKYLVASNASRGLNGEEDQEDPIVRFVIYPDSGPGFESSGHYGSSTIDSMGDEYLHIAVCDGCIVRNAHLVVSWNVKTYKSRQTKQIIKTHLYNYHYQDEDYRKSTEYSTEEVKLFEAYGYEWRNYDHDNKRCPEEHADWNHSGWFKVGSCDSVDPYKGKNVWEHDKELKEKHDALHKRIWATPEPVAHGTEALIHVDEKTGEEVSEAEDMWRRDPNMLKNLRATIRKMKPKKKKAKP